MTVHFTSPFPGSLDDALSAPYLQPGDSLNLAAGPYSRGHRSAALTAENITLRGVSGRPIIDGTLILSGDGLTVAGIEIATLGLTDRETEVDPYPFNKIYGKVTDCIIRDCANGLYVSDENGSGIIIDGCIIFFNGWYDPGLGRGQGHGLYVQSIGPERLTIRNCILFDGFGWGVHGYGSTGQKVDYISYENNICFRAGSLGGTPRPNLLIGGENSDGSAGDLLAPIWTGNKTYGGAPNEFGYMGLRKIIDGVLTDNYMPDGVTVLAKGGNVTESGNITEPEVTNRIFVIQVRNRYHIAIYNWQHLDSVTLTAEQIGALLPAGSAYKLTNVQDLFTDIVTGTVAGDGSITVDMRAASHTVATPNGAGWVQPLTTFPEFGCFVVEKI